MKQKLENNNTRFVYFIETYAINIPLIKVIYFNTRNEIRKS